MMGLTYFDQSPQMSPLIGHWGIMITLLGILLFVSATDKELRKSTIIFAILEKIYIVSAAVYCFVIHAPYAHSYLVTLLVDGVLAVGGIWYLFRSWSLHQA
jgi:hypothetical protein